MFSQVKFTVEERINLVNKRTYLDAVEKHD